MEKRNILVTGGAGYIGSTLCRELLARDYKVLVLDNLMYGGSGIKPFLNHPNYEFIRGDIRDEGLMEKVLEGIDSVIHLAAIVGDVPCKKNPSLAIAVNLDAAKTCYILAKGKGVKQFIFASTCSNYGISDGSMPVSETGKLNPVSIYAETKVDCESFLKDESKKTGMVTSIFRLASAFGLSARNRFDLLINSLTFEALRDNKIMIFTPSIWRPYIHVLDISYLFIMALKADPALVRGEVFNGGNTCMNYQKFQVVEAIEKILGGNIEIKLIKEIEDIRTFRVDFSKVERVLGFKAAKSIEDGIFEIAQAIKNGVITFEDFNSNTLESISEIARKFK